MNCVAASYGTVRGRPEGVQCLQLRRIGSCPHLPSPTKETVDLQNGFAAPDGGWAAQHDANQQRLNSRSEKVTTVLDLIHLTSGHRTVRWRQLPEVRRLRCLDWMAEKQRNLQEALFEVITSEASYLKRLHLLEQHFVRSRLFNDRTSAIRRITPRHYRLLFELLPSLIEVSHRFLADLDARWLSDVISFDICDVIYCHAKQHFGVYAKYCSYQSYQERCLAQLKDNPEFAEELQKLESDPICDNVTLQYFLMLPVQRITKFPLLMEAILKNSEYGSENYRMCALALDKIKLIVLDCNNKTNEIIQREEMLLISNQFEFQAMKRYPLLTSSRRLVRKGEVYGFSSPFAAIFGSTMRPSSSWKTKHVKRICLFAFNDLLIIAKKKHNHEKKFKVLNYCSRNLIVVIGKLNLLMDRTPDGFKHIFQLGLLGPKKEDYLIACHDKMEKQAWIDAIAVTEYKGEKSFRFEEWDCPTVKSLYQYDAQMSDELCLEENDILQVFRKNSDGWCFGKRIRDEAKGWFPGNYTEEEPSVHIRARKLRESYLNRYLQLAEHQQKKDEEKKKSNFFINAIS